MANLNLETINKCFSDTSFEGYQKKHLEQCMEIWKKFVPANGPATCLQGELLRQVEKLRYEAQSNGNINWDSDFDYFCDFLSEHLVDNSSLNDDLRAKILSALDRIRAHGYYACALYNEEIGDDEFDVMKIAHVKDDLYDVVFDAVAEFYLKNPSPISYVVKEGLHR